MLLHIHDAKAEDLHEKKEMSNLGKYLALKVLATGVVRTYVFHLLRTYIILLCNWLILWQNALYLYLGRSRMCLILQETCCSSLVLKPWRLDQETNEEKLFIKAGQIARHLWTDSLIASRHLLTARLSIELFSCLLSQFRHLSIAGGSIEKAFVSSTTPW